MRPMLWLLLLTLALPIGALADSHVDFKNSGGVLSGGTAGLSLSGSILTAVNGLGGMGLVADPNGLGTVAFTTGGIMSGGDVQMGGMFNGGGSFVITGNGMDGIPNAVIFNGSFSGPVSWKLVTLANGTHYYTLTGKVSGSWYTGATVSGATM